MKSKNELDSALVIDAVHSFIASVLGGKSPHVAELQLIDFRRDRCFGRACRSGDAREGSVAVSR
jgi:hypothetical protein